MKFFSRSKSINIIVWPQMLDAQYLIEFEEKTGIHVNISYMENNEELLMKLKTTKDHGYDLMMPSDYFVEKLVKQDFLKKIDKNKLTFWDEIYPEFLNKEFDKGNQYTIPFYWSPIVFGIDTNYFGNKPDSFFSWSLFFDEINGVHGICVPDNMRDLSFMAAYYLFGYKNSLTFQEIEQIKQLLIKQKSRVEVYSEGRLEFILASQVSPLVVLHVADLIKIMRRFKNIDFKIPYEGSFFNIDSFVISKSTDKDDMIYQFLNYLYEARILSLYIKKFDFLPVIKNLELDSLLKRIAIPTEDVLKKLHFYKDIISNDTLSEIIIKVKS